MKTRKRLILPSIVIIIFVIIFFGYSYWSNQEPQNSCGSCHEINPSVETAQYSSHREIPCAECHGTALSNGFHSIYEKFSMLLAHSAENKENSDIHLSENQVLEIITKCKNCHSTEFADWQSSGHSVGYKDIFLNEEHNKIETPYWDCFRCHGMFYEGNIEDLMEPINNKGPWKLKNPEMAGKTVIPCLTCHQIHSENEVRKKPSSYSNPKALFYEREDRNVHFGLYIRAEKTFIRADKLIEPDIFNNGEAVLTSGDDTQTLCVQCHSPNFNHTAGTSDDRTPTGIHEGVSCGSCHAPHSNNAKNMCDNCHPAISNCGLNVKTMNTTYFNSGSPFNIHRVKCVDCHPDKNF